MKLYAQVINTKKDGKSPVYVICYLAGKRCRFHTGVEVTAKEWEPEAGSVLGRGHEAKEKNLLINNVKRKITEIAVKYRLEDKKLTAETLMREYEVPTYSVSFLDFYSNELNKRKGLLSANTLEKHTVTIKKLREFKNDILFCELDVDFLNEFQIYCKKRGNCQNTINSNLRNIKTYIRIAHKKNIIQKNPFEDYKISTITPDRSFLTETEVSTLLKHYKSKYTNETEKKVLRPFLFSCFTSLRFSDVKGLRWDNIIDDVIILQPQKTSYINKTVRIPLCSQARELLNYEARQRHVFSMYSAQYYNRMLKDICASLDIRKTITFHAARHTFATRYLRKTQDILGLQKILGHYSIKDTTIYTHVIDDDIKSNISKLDDIAI